MRGLVLCPCGSVQESCTNQGRQAGRTSRRQGARPSFSTFAARQLRQNSS